MLVYVIAMAVVGALTAKGSILVIQWGGPRPWLCS